MHKRNEPGRERMVAVEDVAEDGGAAEGLVDDQYLDEALHEPRRYLPPPHHAHPLPEPEPEPESALARRAKLAALFIVTALVVASIAAAAVLAGEESGDAGGLSQNPSTSAGYAGPAAIR